MQAMNGTRSAELQGSDVLLDSGGSDPAQQEHLMPATDQPVPDALQHDSAPGAPPMQPAEQVVGSQPGGEGSEAVLHHKGRPSWQQSEGSMQEVASTSASSESGNTFVHSLARGLGSWSCILSHSHSCSCWPTKPKTTFLYKFQTVA